MNILDKIVAHKHEEVALRKAICPAPLLEARPLFARTPLSATEWLRSTHRNGIIAEFKRRSPSKGLINGHAMVSDVAEGYAQAGVSAMSVLTDHAFFGGCVDDLLAARSIVHMPLLRKDFVVDEYQILEAKSLGADLILLIAACLSTEQVRRLAKLAHSLGMQVLLEVHDEQELKANMEAPIDLLGVNNRNLKTFEVSLQTSVRLAPLMPQGVLKVSESGITSGADIRFLRQHGYEGFLIGENFMKTDNPALACKEFTATL